MKKTLLFLMAIVALLSACSKDDIAPVSNTSSQSNKVHWYGVNKTYETALRGVADESKLWNPQAGIAIKFINNPADANMIQKIKSIASEWEDYAGIKFNYVESDKNASVRIAFDWNGNDYLTWSYTGTDARAVKNEAEPTAVFGGLQYQDEQLFRGDVLRVFGQILGLEYEQRHQDWTFWRSETQLQRYWENMFEGYNLNWNEIREYVFTPLNGQNAVYPTQTTQIDEQSIMAWPYYTSTQTTKPLANYKLSDGDKAFIATLYPKNSQSLPTIQEAWVDAGYFVWTDSTKTALRITKLGADQEYLPDVSDGEQLTSAKQMFLYKNSYPAKLKIAPLFNTSNVTDFSYMFESCTSLKNILLLDTSKGTTFYQMFIQCHSLKSIPAIETSKGENFAGMFGYCHSLSTIPLLDTSSGINFYGMFFNCDALTYVPTLNTSKGIYFNSMFAFCTSLKGIPSFNTSNGTTFKSMFENCLSLNQKPNLDLSNATETTDMYLGTRFAN